MQDRGKDGLDKREDCGVMSMLSICNLFKDHCLLLLIHSHFSSLLSFPVFMVLGIRERRKVEENKSSNQ